MEEKLHLEGYLVKARFEGADLRNINFAKANLTSAEFYNCDLRGVSFEEADLWGTKFIASDLRGVNLRGAMTKYMTIENSRGILQFGPVGYYKDMIFAVDWGDKIMFKIDRIWVDKGEAIRYAKSQHWDKSAIEQISQMAKVLEDKR